ncbi:class I SAM-dependent methyltransferase [Streptomyces spectabilis]|uniref:SAM-dependent methyltransferase n=1 Tax=Streptomyces spectabilis TaxID=68270 RepID=A0A5P2XKL4_STRST|nr:class I SAM-dependent methyltransferase [Streptomyces spectabilis]MBB5107056.1 SAM-dependent methyltransferase [Streptomyces spectabilis]MCI3906105.1 class I SAM-dependent methyltransferase [Streptomyces spectabilis]QEV62992.1 class I SAM-dependent methyltransferase [Streptomyces spectabilis]GGV04836.1 SAM-dependent methyltransferase [Streptomyces spectabilis]
MTAYETKTGGHGHDHGDGSGHSHGHKHGHGDHDIDWADMAPVLEQNAEVTAPVYRQVATWLRELRPAGAEPSLVVDAGSGPGVVTCLLAEAFPGAEVVAADPERALLDRAEARAARLGLGDRVRAHRAELPDGLGELPPADLIWAARSVHHVGDQVAALTALGERLAPGGALAVLEGGLPPRSLPRDIGMGRPGLQARLDAANEEWFTRMRGSLPGATEVTEDWAALLAAAGLRHVATRTFLLDLPAPLDERARAHAIATFERYRDLAAAEGPEELAADDVAVLDRLLDPEDPRGLHRRPDMFLLVAHTVHVAVKEG